MVSDLKNTWNSHAFPDEHIGEEAFLAEDSASLREKTRKEIYLEQTTNYRMRRHTHGDDSRGGKATSKQRELDDLMLLAVGSPAYIEAYNHQLNFTINGEDFEISQGRLHEISKRYAADLRTQIDSARKNSLDPAAIALMTAELGHVDRIVEHSDPQRGTMSIEDTIKVREHLEHSEGLQEEIVAENRFDPTLGQANSLPEGSEISYKSDFGLGREAVFEARESIDSSSSFAASLQDSPLDVAVASASAVFNQAALGQSAITPESQEATPSSVNGSGFVL